MSNQLVSCISSITIFLPTALVEEVGQAGQQVGPVLRGVGEHNVPDGSDQLHEIYPLSAAMEDKACNKDKFLQLNQT